LAGADWVLVTGPDGVRDPRVRSVRLDGEAAREWLSICQLPADGALLVRPDRFVAWRSDSAVTLDEALSRLSF